MILPTKQIPPSYSLLAVGSLLLQQLHRPNTVTALWHAVREEDSIGTFERFLTVLCMLHCMDLVEFEEGILIRKRVNDAYKSDK
jgi:hypothetical protein